MDRRSLLRLFGAAPAAALSGLSTKEVAAKLGMGVPNLSDPPSQEETMAFPQPMRSKTDILLGRLWRNGENRRLASQQMPAHIASKKSWSPVYKESVYREELELYQSIIDKIERDEAFAKRAAKLLGF